MNLKKLFHIEKDDNVAVPEKMRNLRKKTLFMTMLRFPRSISITKRSQNSVL